VDPVQLCRETGTDDGVRPIPQTLVRAAKRIFGLRMPGQQVLHSTVFGCAGGTPKLVAQIEEIDPRFRTRYWKPAD
jgi:hypothetical protein